MQHLPLVLIILTCITSINGFSNYNFFNRLKFEVGSILGSKKEWDRIVFSAFLHGDYMHLAFNMLTLYFFAPVIMKMLGAWQFMSIYFGAIIGGGLLSLWMHRKHPNYSAVGASGGVVGVLFASIALFPTIGIRFFFIPIPIPGWLFGVLYLAYSIYAMNKQNDNIGHEAHLGGALVGILFTLSLAPHVLLKNIYYLGIMAIPLFVLGYFIWKKKD